MSSVSHWLAENKKLYISIKVLHVTRLARIKISGGMTHMLMKKLKNNQIVKPQTKMGIFAVAFLFLIKHIAQNNSNASDRI